MKNADSKGRVTLGAPFANRPVLIEHFEDAVIVRVARVLPESVVRALPISDEWLDRDDPARAAVRRGLADARAGRTTPVADVRPKRGSRGR
jgi:predicted transcriptional regulator